MLSDYSNNNQKLKPGLYIVSTPIGNIEDVTIRALNILKNVDYIVCEDTRVTQKILQQYAIKNKLIIYNDFSNNKDREKITEKIRGGLSIALVSDAGTPIISDPGYKLVKALSNENLYYTAIPGACALINGLVLSGAASDLFTFHGFLPIQQKSREQIFSQITENNHTHIIYETSKKLTNTLLDIQKFLGDIEIIITREMTKKFEEIISDKISNLLDKKFLGEIVLIIPKTTITKNTEEVDTQILEITKKLSTKDGQILLQKLYPSIRKNDLYNLLKN